MTQTKTRQLNIKPRGKQGDLIRPVTSIPGTNGGSVPVNFPCLSIHVYVEGQDPDTQYYTVTWSNYYAPKNDADIVPSANPGKFKIQRIEFKTPVIYVLNGNRPAKGRYGHKQVDVLEMRKRGHKLKPERTEMWDRPLEAETVGGACEMFFNRFGKELADQIMGLFMSHELVTKYLPPVIDHFAPTGTATPEDTIVSVT